MWVIIVYNNWGEADMVVLRDELYRLGPCLSAIRCWKKQADGDLMELEFLVFTVCELQIR